MNSRLSGRMLNWQATNGGNIIRRTNEIIRPQEGVLLGDNNMTNEPSHVWTEFFAFRHGTGGGGITTLSSSKRANFSYIDGHVDSLRYSDTKIPQPGGIHYLLRGVKPDSGIAFN